MAAGRPVFNGVTVTRQGRTDEAIGPVVGLLSPLPIIAQWPLMCRQQDIGAEWAPAEVPSATGIMASAQAGAVADIPTHRTLTRASADTGKTDCIISSAAQTIQTADCKRRGITASLYHAACRKVPKVFTGGLDKATTDAP